jgi:hypothetical protein
MSTWVWEQSHHQKIASKLGLWSIFGQLVTAMYQFEQSPAVQDNCSPLGHEWSGNLPSHSCHVHLSVVPCLVQSDPGTHDLPEISLVSLPSKSECCSSVHIHTCSSTKKLWPVTMLMKLYRMGRNYSLSTKSFTLHGISISIRCPWQNGQSRNTCRYSSICCSMVPRMANVSTRTGRVAPIRCARLTTCSSILQPNSFVNIKKPP